jgi:hypothetical protein
LLVCKEEEHGRVRAQGFRSENQATNELEWIESREVEGQDNSTSTPCCRSSPRFRWVGRATIDWCPAPTHRLADPPLNTFSHAAYILPPTHSILCQGLIEKGMIELVRGRLFRDDHLVEYNRAEKRFGIAHHVTPQPRGGRCILTGSWLAFNPFISRQRENSLCHL